MSAVSALSGAAFSLASAGARRSISNRSSALRATAAKATKVRAFSVSAAGSFHDFKGKYAGAGTRAAPTEGDAVDFSSFKGKVVLINNVATM